jgi:hypothetical protein
LQAYVVTDNHEVGCDGREEDEAENRHIYMHAEAEIAARALDEACEVWCEVVMIAIVIVIAIVILIAIAVAVAVAIAVAMRLRLRLRLL